MQIMLFGWCDNVFSVLWHELRPPYGCSKRECVFFSEHDDNFAWSFYEDSGMQMQPSEDNSICLSVSPKVKCVHCDKMEDKSVQIFIPYERSLSLVFEKMNGWWGQPFLTENLGQSDCDGTKSKIFCRYLLVAPQL